MVDVCGKKMKCHSALISYYCDTGERMDVSGVKRGAKTYPCIRSLTSELGASELKVAPTRNAHKMDDVFKSYKHQNTVYTKLLENAKRKEVRAKRDEGVSLLDR